MKPVHIRAEAELDIVEAALWYEGQREGLGLAFSHEIERTVGRVAEAPLTFRERELVEPKAARWAWSRGCR